jgi:hypothetical protein
MPKNKGAPAARRGAAAPPHRPAGAATDSQQPRQARAVRTAAAERTRTTRSASWSSRRTGRVRATLARTAHRRVGKLCTWVLGTAQRLCHAAALRDAPATAAATPACGYAAPRARARRRWGQAWRAVRTQTRRLRPRARAALSADAAAARCFARAPAEYAQVLRMLGARPVQRAAAWLCTRTSAQP